jgi:hypothetical protein
MRTAPIGTLAACAMVASPNMAALRSVANRCVTKVARGLRVLGREVRGSCWGNFDGRFPRSRLPVSPCWCWFPRPASRVRGPPPQLTVCNIAHADERRMRVEGDGPDELCHQPVTLRNSRASGEPDTRPGLRLRVQDRCRLPSSVIASMPHSLGLAYAHASTRERARLLLRFDADRSARLRGESAEVLTQAVRCGGRCCP